ncbi:unnamed protein product [Danaus chrysippus]|uniref:(African queen) hypothetical protein n=1 Tax=Danaus chrysippus TaxID=151541 RepID=A0A8J2W335_9NEOP|nr:unnamed protein product [Danaus chrysippus]
MLENPAEETAHTESGQEYRVPRSAFIRLCRVNNNNAYRGQSDRSVQRGTLRFKSSFHTKTGNVGTPRCLSVLQTRKGKVWIGKWKSLRDNYNKYKKSNESSTGQAYKKYKSWPWASRLSFLDDFNFRRQTESNCENSSANNHTTVALDTENFTMSEKQNTTHSEVTVYGTEPSTQITRKRIKTSSESSDSDKILGYIKNKKKAKLDVVDHIFLSYAQTFKTLPPRMQIMIKLEMASLFARYELQMVEGSNAGASQVVPQSVKERSWSWSSTTNSESEYCDNMSYSSDNSI